MMRILIYRAFTYVRQNGLAPENITTTALRSSSAKKETSIIYVWGDGDSARPVAKGPKNVFSPLLNF